MILFWPWIRTQADELRSCAETSFSVDNIYQANLWIRFRPRESCVEIEPHVLGESIDHFKRVLLCLVGRQGNHYLYPIGSQFEETVLNKNGATFSRVFNCINARLHFACTFSFHLTSTHWSWKERRVRKWIRDWEQWFIRTQRVQIHSTPRGLRYIQSILHRRVDRLRPQYSQRV